MKTNVLKFLRNQAFENLNFIRLWSGGVWITKIDNITYESSIIFRFSELWYVGSNILFLRECIVRAVKARRGEKVNIIVDLSEIDKIWR
jgi:hypothetical protein